MSVERVQVDGCGRGAGLTMPLLWPPFHDVPVAKTLDDLERLREEIMPKIEAM